MRAVEALLSFGRLLGLEVVAVGVETTLQLRVLKALGARQVQGFLLGDPISAEQLRRQIDGDEKAPWREVLSRDEPPLPGLRGLD
jgi:EAL domain-containing protein (putative c-di-GMP-specific phosphodiesterase class I)